MYWKAAISLKNKFKNYSQPYSGWLRYDENSYFDKTLFFTIYSYFDPVSSFKYFWYNIKQKFIFINLLLEVIFLVIFCQDIFANIFNNAPFVFALLLTQMKTYIKPKKSRIFFETISVWFLGMSSVNQTKYCWHRFRSFNVERRLLDPGR